MTRLFTHIENYENILRECGFEMIKKYVNDDPLQVNCLKIEGFRLEYL
jgi:hypothetical protein